MTQGDFVDNQRGIQSIEINKTDERDDSKQSTHTLDQAIEETSTFPFE